FLIVLIGMLVILLGVFSMAYQTWKINGGDSEGGEVKPETTVRGGGVIMIGPIPIVFGSDADAVKVALILTIVVMVLAFALFYLPSWLD
ncbi:MAG: TIGR00304 family membrane protein, partial [Candidatus Methanospirareceae archaeon]